MVGGLSPCGDFSSLFDAPQRPSTFAATIDQPPGSFRCEMQSVSARSLGRPVGDDEVLVRIVVGPKGLKKDGPLGLAESVISEMYRVGLSTLRTNDEGIAAKIERLARYLVDRAAEAIPVGDEAFCAGVLEFSGETLRSFRVSPWAVQMVGAYESPEIDYPNHSDVLQAVNLFISKNHCRNSARNFLYERGVQFIAADVYTRANIRDLRADGRAPA